MPRNYAATPQSHLSKGTIRALARDLPLRG